jgi:adenylate cyclase
VVSRHYAQIYQYTGDEIVITWTIEEGLKNFSCIQIFFACQQKFRERGGYYLKQYGQVPEFNLGKVTAVEVGDIKRDIAYHGDTLNTTARIQSVCNYYNRNFLMSAQVAESTEMKKYYKIESIGMVELKGKNIPIEIASINLLS